MPLALLVDPLKSSRLPSLQLLFVQESDKVLEDMWDVLQQHPVVGLLQLCLNHASFSQTVENLFQLSFLVSQRACLRASGQLLLVSLLLASEADAASCPCCKEM